MRVEEVVGWQVRQRRERQGLTQEQLGRDLGPLLGRPWSRQAVSAAEKGERTFGAAELVALATVLHTTIGDLLRPPVEESAVDLGGTDAVTRDVLFSAITGEVAEEAVTAAAVQATLGELAGSILETSRDFDRMMTLIRNLDAQIMGRLADQGIVSHKRVSRATREVSNYDPERGEWVKREQPNQEDELQPVATAIVTSERGVLVGRRNDGKPPWTFIAGEVEPGESPEFAAVREVKEETGLEAQPREEIGRRVHPKTGRTMIYVAAAPVRPDDLEVFVGDSEELAEVRWVSLAEADELMAAYGMFEPVHEYLARELGA